MAENMGKVDKRWNRKVREGAENQERKYGRDVTASFIYLRHTEKASGSLIGAVGQASRSASSLRGLEMSQHLGKQLSRLSPPANSPLKIRHSTLVRTYEAAKAVEKGYKPLSEQERSFRLAELGLDDEGRPAGLSEVKKAAWDARMRTIGKGRSVDGAVAQNIVVESAIAMDEYVPRIKMEFSADLFPSEFMKVYGQKWDALKVGLMQERGILPEGFSILSPDEQAKVAKATFDRLSSKDQASIAEPAEEPLFREWLDNPDSELARLFPFDEAASHAAVIVRRDSETPQLLRNGSVQNFLSETHRFVMEPLLMKIINLPDGSKPQKIADIGGPLGLNDGWELRVRTDKKGKPTTSLLMYRVKDQSVDEPEYEQWEYAIDIDGLNRLADIGVQANRNRRTAELAKNPQ